jgi:hypothetical protein
LWPKIASILIFISGICPGSGMCRCSEDW